MSEIDDEAKRQAKALRARGLQLLGKVDHSIAVNVGRIVWFFVRYGFVMVLGRYLIP